MIYLHQNASNNVYLTLSESVTLTGNNIYYLFRFIDETTNVETLFSAQDTSSAITRYNLFNIILTASTSVNLSAGTLNLNQGYSSYEVYQTYIPYDLHLSATTGGPIEYGKVYISGASLSIVTKSYTGNTNTFKAYNG